METNNNMKRIDGKRGLSPVIASLLMIMLVLFLAAIVFLWARGFISEQIEKFGKPIEEQCESVKFKIVQVEEYLEIRNNGNVDIWRLDIKMFSGGNSEVKGFDFQINAGEAIRKAVTLEMSDGSLPDKIIAYPALIGNVRDKPINKVFTCMNAGVTL